MKDYKDFNDYEVMYLVEEGSEDAENIIIDKYTPLIKSMASSYLKQFSRYGIEIDDLVQEGYIGLYSAIKGYHASRNTLFYTYAIILIRSKMLNFLRKYTSQKNFANIGCISLSQDISDDNDETLFSLIEDKNVLLPDEVLNLDEIESKIRDFMYSLDFPLSLIFELKFNGFSNKDISILLDYPFRKLANDVFKIRKNCSKILAH